MPSPSAPLLDEADMGGAEGPAGGHHGAIEPNLRRLRAFMAVYRSGSLLRASEQLHVAQSSLTRAVQDIERPLGVPLFERTQRGMVPTEFGAILAGRTQRAFVHLQAAEHELKDLAHELPGPGAPQDFAARVTHRQLAALIGIADNHSETAAARHLALSQPAVAAALRGLEAAVGVLLFRRSSRGTSLTMAGELLLRHAKLAFAEIQAAASDIAARAGVLAGRVVIGALPLAGALLTPRAVGLLLQEHGNLQVSVVDGTYAALRQGLLCGDIDVVVGGLSFPVPPEIVQEVLFTDSLVCVVRSGHPLLQGGACAVGDLRGQEWVLARSGTPVRVQTDGILRTLGVDVGVNPVESNSLSMVRALLLESDRVAVISRQQVHYEVAMGSLAVLPVQLPDAGMPIGIRTRAAAQLSLGVQVLLGCLRRVTAEITAGSRG